MIEDYSSALFHWGLWFNKIYFKYVYRASCAVRAKVRPQRSPFILLIVLCNTFKILLWWIDVDMRRATGRQYFTTIFRFNKSNYNTHLRVCYKIWFFKIRFHHGQCLRPFSPQCKTAVFTFVKSFVNCLWSIGHKRHKRDPLIRF